MLNTKIDKNDYLPYYIQVKNSIQEQIKSGGWKVGDKMPGELELESMFNVSRTVIRQALKELEIEGLIVREKGRGTFVAEEKINYRMVQELTGFFQDAVEQGKTPFTKILSQELVPATPEIADFLKIDPGSVVIKMHRLRGIKDEPLFLDTTYLPYDLCPRVLDTDFSSRSLYAFLEDELGFVISRAHRTIKAVLATEYVADMLMLSAGDPVIVFDSVAYLADGKPIEYFKGFHSTGDTCFAVDLVRIRDK